MLQQILIVCQVFAKHYVMIQVRVSWVNDYSRVKSLLSKHCFVISHSLVNKELKPMDLRYKGNLCNSIYDV